MHDVIIVGGGVIGLSIAREVAAHGRTVMVWNRGPAEEAASWAAAGMLAPLSEAEQGDAYFNLCLASMRMYRAWADHLGEQTGIDPEYATSGLLCVASTDEKLAVLARRAEWQRSMGFQAEYRDAATVRQMEPLITLPVAGGVFMPSEHHVTPRRLLEALKAACLSRGVEIRTNARVDEVLHNGRRVTGVRAGDERFASNAVVIASGAWSGEIAGLEPQIPVRPRKGQILALAAEKPTFGRMIRWGNIYFIPRRDGELIVGATNEDAGFNRALTPAGIGGLLAEAQQLAASTGSHSIAEMWSGFRPATADALPIIGRAGREGLFYATGHYRNGILLAPITAIIVSALIDGRTLDLPLEPYSPARFGSD